MMTEMTVGTAWKVYGLDNYESLQKKIKYQKDKGSLPKTVGHLKNDPFTEETAKFLGLEKVGESEGENQGPENSDLPENGDGGKRKSPTKKKPKKRNATTEKAEVSDPENDQTELQKELSANWLVKWVLYSLILMDGIAFALIADRMLNSNTYYTIGFFYMGIMAGIGAIAMYCKINKLQDAEGFKYSYGVLQFIVFEVAIQTSLLSWETCMSIMVVLVEMGLMRSIRK